MDPTRLMTMPCTITPRTPAADPDEYNDEILEAGTPVDVDPGCFLWQTERSERGDDNTQAETFQVSLPPEVAVDGRSWLTIDGADYELDGPPWPAWNPRLHRYTHIEATVRRVT